MPGVELEQIGYAVRCTPDLVWAICQAVRHELLHDRQKLSARMDNFLEAVLSSCWRQALLALWNPRVWSTTRRQRFAAAVSIPTGRSVVLYEAAVGTTVMAFVRNRAEPSPVLCAPYCHSEATRFASTAWLSFSQLSVPVLCEKQPVWSPL